MDNVEEQILGFCCSINSLKSGECEENNPSWKQDDLEARKQGMANAPRDCPDSPYRKNTNPIKGRLSTQTQVVDFCRVANFTFDGFFSR